MRWGAGIIGGFLVGFLLYLLGSFAAAAPQPWIGLVGWIGLGHWFARSGAMAWVRVWAAMAAGCFALPLAALAAVARVGSEAEKVGDPLSSALGPAGALLTGSAGFAAVLLGIPFAALAYVTFKRAHSPAQEDS